MSERVKSMAEEQKQASAPGGAPRREGGHGGPGGGHGGHRREGGPGRARARSANAGPGDSGASRGDTNASGRSAEGLREQEHREKTCKLFFRKTSKSWATAATWSR